MSSNITLNSNVSCSLTSNNGVCELYIPKDYRYATDVFERLPTGYFIDKSVTGCGMTTLAITDSEYYVIAMPRKLLVESKGEIYPDVIQVHGDVSNAQIAPMIGKSKKILTTFDSLERVVDLLGKNTSMYHLVVDEAHILITEGGDYRKDAVCSLYNRIIGDVSRNEMSLFKSITFITATPTNRKWLPSGIADMPILKLNWECSSPIKIISSSVPDNVIIPAVTYALDIYDKKMGVPFIFVNSVTSIISIIKKLVELRGKSGLSVSDFKVICSDCKDNRKKLKRIDLEPSRPSLHSDETSKFVLITRTAFEGTDFFCENGIPIVVSDVRFRFRDGTKIDISVDLPQIVGRIRNQKPELKNTLFFIYNSPLDSVSLSVDEYYKQVLKWDEEVPEMLAAMYNNSAGLQRVLQNGFCNSPLFSFHERKWIRNPLGVSAMMTMYEALHVNYRIMGGSQITNDVLLSVYDTANTPLPELNQADKKILMKQGDKSKVIVEMIDAIAEENSGLFYQLLSEFPESAQLISDIGISNCCRYGGRYDKLVSIRDTKLGEKSMKENPQLWVAEMGVRDGEFHSLASLKVLLKAAAGRLGFPDYKAKASHCEHFMKCRRTNRGKVNGFIIECINPSVCNRVESSDIYEILRGDFLTCKEA